VAHPPQKRRWTIGIGGLAVATAITVLAIGLHKHYWPLISPDVSADAKSKDKKSERSVSEIVELSAKSVEIMNLRTVLAVVPRYSRVLHLRGQLAIDPNRLVHVHARFPGQVVELATVRGLRSQPTDESVARASTLQNFDTVVSGAPMAVLWSKDLGEKKSQLADALAKLRLDRQTLTNFSELTKSGSISDREFREQRAKVELGEIAVFTAEATLRSFLVTEQDIEVVKAASEKIHRSQQTDQHYASDWARVVVSSPISGVIVDKNLTVGEIVDANADLFKVADLSVLAIYLHAYEEDLPAIENMTVPLPVAIKVPANPEIGELPGLVARIGPIIDPNEHMALLIGSVKNPKGSLRAGQFITGDIGIPAEQDVVEIPSNALIDVGNDAVVYVQPDRSQPRFERRRVVVAQRHFDLVQVRSELTSEQKELGLREIHVDDRVVAGGVLELEDYLAQQE